MYKVGMRLICVHVSTVLGYKCFGFFLIGFSCLQGYCNFIQGYICRTSVNFGTLEVGILLACGINTYYGYTNRIQTSDVSICNGNKKYPIGTLTFYMDFCIQALSCFNYCC